MLLSLAYTLLRFLADLLLVRTRSDVRLRAEVPALRHQLPVLERKAGKLRWQPSDRLVLASLSRLLPKSRWSALLPSPETLLRWHRELVRRKWAAYRRRPPRRRLARDPQLRELILRLASENPRWGYRRIQGEVLKLGFRISHMGVAKILRSHHIPPAPRRGRSSWRQFVRQHADQILATDFFTVETVWLTRLHVLVFIEIASRKVHLGGVTAHPAGEWVAQQARNLAWKLQDGKLTARFLADEDLIEATGEPGVAIVEQAQVVNFVDRVWSVSADRQQRLERPPIRWLAGLRLDPWRTLEAATGVMIPMDQGIYRLRCAGLDGLAYVGIRVNLRKRLRGLRRGLSNPPDYLGHSASGCLAESQRRHHAQIEVSFVTMVGTKPKELKGLEVDLIAANRDAVKTSPPFQFVGHGGKLELDDQGAE